MGVICKIGKKWGYFAKSAKNGGILKNQLFSENSKNGGILKNRLWAKNFDKLGFICLKICGDHFRIRNGG